MMSTSRRSRLIAAMLAATALQGCSAVSSLNVLAAIDGPFVSAEEQAATEQAETENTQNTAAAVTQPAPVAQPAPEPEPVQLAVAVEAGPMETAPAQDAKPSAEIAIVDLTPEPAAAPDAELAVEPVPEWTLAPIAEAPPEPEDAPEVEQRAQLTLPDAPVMAAPTAEPRPQLTLPPVTDTPPAEPDPVSAPLIGPDFLPPEPDLPAEEPVAAPIEQDIQLAIAPEAEPVPETEPEAETEPVAEAAPEQLAAAPAPIAARETPAAAAGPNIVGPILVEEEPVQLATRLPSAFDFVAEEVEDAPEPEPEPERAALTLPPPAPEPAPPAPVAVTTLPAPDPFEPIFEDTPALVNVPEVAQDPAPGFALLAEDNPPVPAPAPAPEPEPSDLEREAEALGLTVVSGLPAPAASSGRSPATGRGGSYRAFYDFALAKLELLPASGSRESMLLLDPPSLDPALQRCGNLPPAVLVDLDPANGLLPLVSNNRADPVLIQYLEDLRQRGVTVFWISGHGPGAASAIRGRLEQSALDAAGNDPLVVTRFAGESKQGRRYSLGETHCLLAILGDHRADFDELYDFVLDPVMAGPLEIHIDEGWFIAPPPLD